MKDEIAVPVSSNLKGKVTSLPGLGSLWAIGRICVVEKQDRIRKLVDWVVLVILNVARPLAFFHVLR